MVPMAENLPTPRRWREPCTRNGRRRPAASPMSSAPAANLCCNSMPRPIAAFKAQGFEIGIETNGTLLPPPGIDWICVSPKADAEQKLTRGDELKLVYPQDKAPPERFAGQNFRHFFLQPMDNEDRAANTAGGDSLLPGPSAMAAVAADPQIAGNSLRPSSAYGLKPCAREHGAPGLFAPAKSRPALHLMTQFRGSLSWIPGMSRWFPLRWRWPSSATASGSPTPEAADGPSEIAHDLVHLGPGPSPPVRRSKCRYR